MNKVIDILLGHTSERLGLDLPVNIVPLEILG